MVSPFRFRSNQVTSIFCHLLSEYPRIDQSANRMTANCPVGPRRQLLIDHHVSVLGAISSWDRCWI